MTQIEAYLLSLIIEGIAATGIAMVMAGQKRRAALAAMVGTTLTHPFVWQGALLLYPVLGYVPTLLVVEAGAVVAEAGGYRLFAVQGWGLALFYSLIANGASFLIGLMLMLA
ncbi:MAG: hypothetical protein HXY22_08520 [Alphaproteobacteria bacterium]|nr:hypothetical protein [Alphaproteobacteria bacterium]